MSDSDRSNDSNRRIKIVRVIEEYNLEGVGDVLEHRWTAKEDRLSLRDLADYFNRQVLDAAMTEVRMQPLDGEVDNVYRLLTADQVGSADRTRARRRLEGNGIDVERLERDFVTYQAIRSYLKEHRGAEPSTNERPRIDVERENLQRVRGRMVSVTDGKLDQLVNGDLLTLGDYRVLVEINVLCDDCGTQNDVIELLEQGGCACATEV